MEDYKEEEVVQWGSDQESLVLGQALPSTHCVTWVCFCLLSPVSPSVQRGRTLLTLASCAT